MKTLFRITILFFGIFFISIPTKAQLISSGVLSAGGKTLSSTDLQLSYTVGEPAVALIGASNAEFNEGFQQPYPSLYVGSQQNSKTLNQEFSLYPNPSNGILHLQWNGNVNQEFILEIFNMNGQMLQKEKVKQNAQNFSIDVSQLATGLYNIHFIGQGNEGLSNENQSLKFIKN